ncbi:unnamed protein product, partial [Merluccius merluccius]
MLLGRTGTGGLESGDTDRPGLRGNTERLGRCGVVEPSRCPRVPRGRSLHTIQSTQKAQLKPGPGVDQEPNRDDSLAGQREVSCQPVKVKQEAEEEPTEICPAHIYNQPITEQMCLSTITGSNNINVKTEEQELCGANMAAPLNPRFKMADQVAFPIKTEDGRFHCGESMGKPFEPGSKMAAGTPSGAKMAEQCLKGVLWQDMSVNLASTLLHQLSEGRWLCPFNPPASSSVPVAMETQPQSSEHRCRICQRSFPGQQELLVHFKGHRQGNQYRCD